MGTSAFRHRIALLRQRLFENGNESFDAAWILQPENRRYLSGFKAQDSQLTESSGSLLITGKDLILVTDGRYTTEAEEEAVDFQVYTIKQDFAESFAEILHSVGAVSVGFEEEFVTWGLHRQLSEKLRSFSSPVRLVPLEGIVEEMREVKDPLEIQAMAASADLISQIVDEVISWLKPGMAEKRVAWQIEGLAREKGADGLAFPSIVASGPHGALPHAVPTERPLKAGEPIILDVGVRLHGYCSDMTRTVFLGEPDPEFRNIYRIVRQAQIAALKETRPGVQSTHPDSTARQVIGDQGFGDYFTHSLGHGVGLATHERPRLGPRKPVKLKAGMVVTVEPGVYLPGKGGVRLEEMVVIQDDGPRILTKSRCFYDFAP